MPPCTDVLALAELFGVSTDYMFGRKEQPVPPAVALLDQGLLDRLGKAENAAQFDAIVSERMDQTAWLPVPDDVDASVGVEQVASRHQSSGRASGAAGSSGI